MPKYTSWTMPRSGWSELPDTVRDGQVTPEMIKRVKKELSEQELSKAFNRPPVSQRTLVTMLD